MQELLDRYGGGAHQKSLAALKKCGLKLQSPMLQSKKGVKTPQDLENSTDFKSDDLKRDLNSDLMNGHCDAETTNNENNSNDIMDRDTVKTHGDTKDISYEIKKEELTSPSILDIKSPHNSGKTHNENEMLFKIYR